MKYFPYKNNELYVENVPLQVLADQMGTPCYVYSQSTIQHNFEAFEQAFGQQPHKICYAVKANSNIAILQLLAKLGSGFDIVSVGELERVLIAGGDPKKIVFSGVGKQDHEIVRALQVGIYCFNVESESELDHLNNIAKKQKKIANIALRINPNIDARTHPYIATGLNENKFGIDLNLVMTFIEHIKHLNHLNLIGIGCHIGSQLTDLEPFTDALDCLLALVDPIQNQGIDLKSLNIGGGLGIQYQDENPPLIMDYVDLLINKMKSTSLEIIIEPGRVIVGNAGILLTQIKYLKHSEHKNFAIVDAAMNDFIRPALYDAWHQVLPVIQRTQVPLLYDVVGPVCESSDFLAKDRELAIEPGDLLAIANAGAYGFSMSSNYNSRPRPCEVLVHNEQIHLIRKRETINELFSGEKLL